MKNRILLIKAERLSETDRWVVNPLGLLYLASVARGMGFETDILDLRIIKENEWMTVLDERLKSGCDLIGLSALSHQARIFRLVSERAARLAPDTPQVGGGPLAGSETEYCLRRTNIDLAVLGEGETALIEILERLKSGAPLTGIPGTAHLDEAGGLVVNPRQGFIKNPDALPTPSWDLIDFDEYGRFLAMSMRLGRRASIQTSRGCPYHCVFCHSFFGKTFRGQSPEKALDQMAILYHKHRIRHFEIIDDIFNWDAQRAKEILKGIAAKFPWAVLSFPNAVRGDILDEEIIGLMKKARTRYLVVAIETASPRLQRRTRKNIDIEHLKKNISLIKKAGIFVAAYFMVGFPDETVEEMEATLSLARNLPLNIAHVSVVNAYRNTELWNMTDKAFRTKADVEGFDPRYGYEGNPLSAVPAEKLIEKSLNLARRQIFRRPGNWFIIGNEILFRLRNGAPVSEKIRSWADRARNDRRPSPTRRVTDDFYE